MVRPGKRVRSREPDKKELAKAIKGPRLQKEVAKAMEVVAEVRNRKIPRLPARHRSCFLERLTVRRPRAR